MNPPEDNMANEGRFTGHIYLTENMLTDGGSESESESENSLLVLLCSLYTLKI